jgi:hypothetical protein
VSQLIKACGAIAETRSANAAAPPRIPFILQGPDDPALKPLLLDPSLYDSCPFAHYNTYSKNATDFLLDEEGWLRPESPRLKPLYFFDQYNHMVKRIDTFCKWSEQCGEPIPPALGRASSIIESLVRKYPDYGYARHRWSHRDGAFSAPGDSGSVIADANSCIVEEATQETRRGYLRFRPN